MPTAPSRKYFRPRATDSGDASALIDPTMMGRLAKAALVKRDGLAMDTGNIHGARRTITTAPSRQVKCRTRPQRPQQRPGSHVNIFESQNTRWNYSRPRAFATVSNSEEILLPARSQAQQKAAGAALAAKRGDAPQSKLKGASKAMARSMTEGQLEELATTDGKSLPARKVASNAKPKKTSEKRAK